VAALVLVRIAVSAPDTEIVGRLAMNVSRDEPTDTHLGFMPALKLYSQGRTPQEAERLMEKAVALYLETAAKEGQLWKILLARGFRRLSGSGGEKPTEFLTIERRRPNVGPEEPEMELEFAGAN
jgi:hypothetical protein